MVLKLTFHPRAMSRWRAACTLLPIALFSGAIACGARQRSDGGKGLLPAGSLVPSLVSVDQQGARQTLAAERGRFVVVYFYPKDGTPGCTKEACAFRDVWNRYQEAGVRVFGVSADDQATHARFAAEHHLPFPLLADEKHVWSQAFGVGTTFGFDARVTFLLDPEGRVAQVYPDVDPGVHATKVLQDVAARSSPKPLPFPRPG